MNSNSAIFTGFVKSLSVPIDHVEPGMLFTFDGSKMVVFRHEPLDQSVLMERFFGSLSGQ